MSEIVWEGADDLRQHLVPIGSLRAHPENPHAGNTIEIGYSLARFGQVRPVLTWENCEEFGFEPNTLVAGHHVWLAAQQMTFDSGKWTHIAAIPARFESASKALEYLVVDNATAQRQAKEIQGQMKVWESIPEKERDPRIVATTLEAAAHAVELHPLDELKAHPDNYKEHPEDQLKHIAASLDALGFAKPIVIANDGTVLAGHGVMKAAAMLGIENVPVKRLPIAADSPEARAYLTGDNEIGRHGELDDRAMAEHIRLLHEETGNLIGSGYDTQTFALLLLSTRTAVELKDANEAAEWIGLPEFEKVAQPLKLVVNFDDEEQRAIFIGKLGVEVHAKSNLSTISMWWPPRPQNDPGSLRFVDANRDKWKDAETIEKDQMTINA